MPASNSRTVISPLGEATFKGPAFPNCAAKLAVAKSASKQGRVARKVDMSSPYEAGKLRASASGVSGTPNYTSVNDNVELSGRRLSGHGDILAQTLVVIEHGKGGGKGCIA